MNDFPRLWNSLINSETGMPVVVNSVQRIMDSRFHAETESIHDEFELIYIQETDKGGFEIDGSFITVRANDLILIKPNVPHKIRLDSNRPFRFLALKFSFSKNTEQTYAGISVNDFLSFITENTENCSYFSISNIYCTNIAALMRQIIHEDKAPDRESEFLRSLLTMELFVWLSRSLRVQWETTLSSKGHKLQEMLEEARNFIDENYNADISLSEIAGYVYISTSHFARAFKKYYDTTPGKFRKT